MPTNCGKSNNYCVGAEEEENNDLYDYGTSPLENAFVVTQFDPTPNAVITSPERHTSAHAVASQGKDQRGDRNPSGRRRRSEPARSGSHAGSPLYEQRDERKRSDGDESEHHAFFPALKYQSLRRVSQNAEGPPPAHPRRDVALGIFLVGLLCLMVELLHTRMLAFFLGSISNFLAIPVSLFGLALGALLVHREL